MIVFQISLAILLGAFLGLSNLYLGLRLGFTIGVALLTVFCLAGIDHLCSRFWSKWHRFDRSQYVCYQSLSSAMSYGSGTVIATTLAALVMSRDQDPQVVLLVLWVMGICGFGTCLAHPLRETMLSRYPFPSGKVAAEAVEDLGGRGKSKHFLSGMGISSLIVLLREKTAFIPGAWPNGTIGLSISPTLIGLGALLGIPICWSLFAGGVTFFVAGPKLLGDDEAGTQPFMWFAISLLVCATLAELAIQFKAYRGCGSEIKGKAKTRKETWLFASLLVLVSGPGLGGSWVTILIGLLLSGFFALIACRVTGQTDVVPTGTLGKLSLLILGFLQPGQTGGNMIATGILTGSSAASADFMTDLRCGKALGTDPERQYRFQLAGALIGPVIFVPIALSLAKRHGFGGDVLPAPAASLWMGVAEMFSQGWEASQTRIWWAMGWGGCTGILMSFLERHYPNQKWIPSPVPFATAIVLDGPTTFTLLIGSLVGHLLKGRGFSLLCGFIAAESVIMTAILLLM